MQRSARYLILAYVVALTVPSFAAEPVEDPLLAAARKSAEDPFLPGVESELEQRALDRAGPLAKRAGKRLSLATGGGIITYTDDMPNVLTLGGMGFEVTEDPECAGKTARCNTFKLLAYLEEQRLFVIKHAWLKRVDYILVSSVSGVASVFDAFPYISPDGKFVFGHGLYEIVGEDKPGPLKGQPRIDVWTRAGWRYVPHWEGAPHKQEHGKQVYKFDRWIAKTYQLKTNQTILEAHLEVDGKTAARFQLRDSNGPEEMEVVDLP